MPADGVRGTPRRLHGRRPAAGGGEQERRSRHGARRPAQAPSSCATRAAASARPRPARCRDEARARRQSRRRRHRRRLVARDLPERVVGGTVRPDMSQSRAVGIPTSRGRNHDEHASGTMPRPREHEAEARLRRGEARVHRERHRRPDPIAWPLTAAMTGFVQSKIRSATTPPGSRPVIACHRRRSARPEPRSAPAQKARPEPVITTARTSRVGVDAIERVAELALHRVRERVRADRDGAA